MVDHIGARTLPDFLAERVERSPDDVALVFESREGGVEEIAYAELASLTARAAGGLAWLGIGQGDKVVLHLPNCPEFVIMFFALAHLGAVAVPSNTANRAPEMLHVIGWSDARVVVTTPAFLELFDE